MRRSRTVRFCFLLALAAVVLGAPELSAGKKKKNKKADAVVFSGFLENYEQLRPAAEFSGFLWGYTKEPGILRQYDKAILDPILVYLHPEAKGVGLDPAKLDELTSYFRDRILDEIAKVREIEIVDQEGPGVMRVRIAITEIEAVKKGANIGVKAAGTAVGVGLFVPAVDVGGATMECEVLDSVSGERLVAVVDRDTGRRMMNFNGMKSMGDAKAAMREWAGEFSSNLQRIHDGKLPKGIERARKKREKQSGD